MALYTAKIASDKGVFLLGENMNHARLRWVVRGALVNVDRASQWQTSRKFTLNKQGIAAVCRDNGLNLGDCEFAVLIIKRDE